MPVFWFLVFLLAALLWLLLSQAYLPLGRLAARLYADAFAAITQDDPNNNSK